MLFPFGFGVAESAPGPETRKIPSDLHRAVRQGDDVHLPVGAAPGRARAVGDDEAREVVVDPRNHRDALAEVVEHLGLADVEELALRRGLFVRVVAENGEPPEDTLGTHRRLASHGARPGGRGDEGDRRPRGVARY
jgi:hypothetical protein